MAWLVVVFTIVWVLVLGRAFLRSARAIRRDIDDRYERIRLQLEDEATNVIRPTIEDDSRV